MIFFFNVLAVIFLPFEAFAALVLWQWKAYLILILEGIHRSVSFPNQMHTCLLDINILASSLIALLPESVK